MITLDLHGAAALVTGASGGIGARIAERLAEAGAHVAVHSRSDAAGAERVRDAIVAAGGAAFVVAGDLTDPAQVEAMFDLVADGTGGPCQILVNNAGSYPVLPLLSMTEVAWSAVMADNATSAMSCLTAAARRMVAHGVDGSIVNVASLSALRPAPDQAHYNAAKAAVLALTASAALELAPHGIRVNAVCPGLVDRPTLRDEWPEGVARWLARSPLGRLGQPDDVADACLFLASSLSAWITGQHLVVDGGTSIAPAY